MLRRLINSRKLFCNNLLYMNTITHVNPRISILMFNMKFSVESSSYSQVSNDLYESVSTKALNTIQYALEDDALNDLIKCDLEVDREGDVLELVIDDKLTWVINRHNATQQIWLSSPISGPRKFIYSKDKNTWIDQRDDSIALLSLLQTEMKQTLNITELEF